MPFNFVAAFDILLHNLRLSDFDARVHDCRRFGTWKVATLSMRGAIFRDGPVCNGSEIIGWSTRELTRRFHADMSGFAFNSTILWDPKRWHRHILEPIRQIDTLKERFLVGSILSFLFFFAIFVFFLKAK